MNTDYCDISTQKLKNLFTDEDGDIDQYMMDRKPELYQNAQRLLNQNADLSAVIDIAIIADLVDPLHALFPDGWAVPKFLELCLKYGQMPIEKTHGILHYLVLGPMQNTIFIKEENLISSEQASDQEYRDCLKMIQILLDYGYDPNYRCSDCNWDQNNANEITAWENYLQGVYECGYNEHPFWWEGEIKKLLSPPYSQTSLNSF